ncbi:FAD-dependent oxidoreductase [Chromatiales bacterium (ex Bugula neritina AB1)]|nr:FAD-dependent oxidoreductase [Chromatiales bacterium (ex Bugula neritina AB1)]
MSEYPVQTVVVGAGVVGLACAAALARSGREVLVLESEASIGQGVSSRNSEVIHAGIYYPPGSLKAEVCVRGRHLLYERCKTHHIKARAIGKLIVATTTDEIEALQRLAERAAANGVDDIEMLDGNTAMNQQPGLQCVAALHSPSTGILDSHGLLLSLHGEIENHDGMVVCRAPVTHAEIRNGQFAVTVGGDSAMSITADELINCTSLNAVQFAAQLGHQAEGTIPRARYAKGNYFRVQGKVPFSKLIYPAPVAGGLGVHLTLDIGGQARFGPDVQWLEAESATGGFNYHVDPARAESFYNAIRKYWPALPDNALLPDYAGVRPKITREGSAEMDFEISTPAQHGVPGLINLFGIESPGLTSSLAIAEIVDNALHKQ